MQGDQEREDEEDYGFESGPFCRHWGDPSNCDEKCKRCGHFCCRHEDAASCNEEGCACEGWVGDEEPAPKQPAQ